ncbi:hypothetical protein HDE_10239 [Halotydeus destructor]|nr:hypothetical protein HDE_10239 [Halotydeus destructor]
MAPRVVAATEMNDFDETDICESLANLIFEQNKIVTYLDVCRDHGLAAAKSQELLRKFAEDKKDKLVVKYVLSGHQSTGEDGLKIRKFMEVDEEELDECKSMHFTEATSYIRSLGPKNEDEEPSEIAAASDHNILRDDSDIQRDQNYTLLKNIKVGIRQGNMKFVAVESPAESQVKKEVSPKPVSKGSSTKSLFGKRAVNGASAKKTIKAVDDKDHESSERNSSQSSGLLEEVSLKPNSGLNGTKKPKDKTSLAFSDDDDEVQKPAEKELRKETDESLSEDEETKEIAKKPSAKKSKAKKKEESESEEEVVKVTSKGSSNSKKSKKQLDSESEVEDESPVKKPRRRVKAKFDSDSENEQSTATRPSKKRKKKIAISEDESEEEAPRPRKPLAPFDPKELKEEDDLYEDEDGYLVTKKVKKCVSVEAKDEIAETTSKPEVKPATKKKKNEPEAKKSAKKDKNVGQKSIMNFFKPTVKS